MDLLYAMTVAGSIPVIVYYIFGIVMKGRSDEKWRMILLKLSMFFFLCPFQIMKYRLKDKIPVLFHNAESGR